jgi:hypothetical protein
MAALLFPTELNIDIAIGDRYRLKMFVFVVFKWMTMMTSLFSNQSASSLNICFNTKLMCPPAE